ncbi:unnamed protein product [Chrysoparadoxa australica]
MRQLSSTFLFLLMLVGLTRGITGFAVGGILAARARPGHRTLAMASTIGDLSVLHLNDGYGGEGLVLGPPGGEYKNVVIWLHGLGDTANGWAGAMPQFKVPQTKFILPTAESIPVTMNGGFRMPAFFDLKSLDPNVPEDAAGIQKTSKRIVKMIETETAEGKAVVIGGFSQGGAIALHVAMRTATPLAGCVAASTWMPLRGDYPEALTAMGKRVPVQMCHGERDEVVLFPIGNLTRQVLSEYGIDVAFEAYAGMGHSACEPEMETIGAFLRKCFS